MLHVLLLLLSHYTVVETNTINQISDPKPVSELSYHIPHELNLLFVVLGRQEMPVTHSSLYWALCG